MKIAYQSTQINQSIETQQNQNSLRTSTTVISTSNAPRELNFHNIQEQVNAIKNINDAFPPRVQEKLLAAYQGMKTRRQVSVTTSAPSIIKTTIRRPSDSAPQNKSHPLDQIQSLLKPGATYVRMHILGGGQSNCVIGTKNNEIPRSPIELAKQTSEGAAVINGGYFVHKDGLISDKGNKLNIGAPIGETLTRTDNAPIPGIWKEEYGQIIIDDQIALTSGPVLALNGEQITLPEHDRMKYHLNGEENPLNKYAGALTHSSGYNERAAISTLSSSSTGIGETIMHTLVSNGDRTAGASMSEWQALTSAGVASLPGGRLTGQQIDSSTINLDGGGSVFLGTTTKDGIAVHALGGASTEETIRPVANVIVSRPGNVGKIEILPVQG